MPRANVQAIAKTIEALRGIARWQSSGFVRSMFRGFTALPPPEEHPKLAQSWQSALGLSADATIEQAETQYRTLAKHAHPDAGGSTEQMAALNRAIREARAHA